MSKWKVWKGTSGFWFACDFETSDSEGRYTSAGMFNTQKEAMYHVDRKIEEELDKHLEEVVRKFWSQKD